MSYLACPCGTTIMCKNYRNHQATSSHIKNLKRRYLIGVPVVYPCPQCDEVYTNHHHFSHFQSIVCQQNKNKKLKIIEGLKNQYLALVENLNRNDRLHVLKNGSLTRRIQILHEAIIYLYPEHQQLLAAREKQAQLDYTRQEKNIQKPQGNLNKLEFNSQQKNRRSKQSKNKQIKQKKIKKIPQSNRRASRQQQHQQPAQLINNYQMNSQQTLPSNLANQYLTERELPKKDNAFKLAKQNQLSSRTKNRRDINLRQEQYQNEQLGQLNPVKKLPKNPKSQDIRNNAQLYQQNSDIFNPYEQQIQQEENSVYQRLQNLKRTTKQMDQEHQLVVSKTKQTQLTFSTWEKSIRKHKEQFNRSEYLFQQQQEPEFEQLGIQQSIQEQSEQIEQKQAIQIDENQQIPQSNRHASRQQQHQQQQRQEHEYLEQEKHYQPNNQQIEHKDQHNQLVNYGVKNKIHK